MTSAQQATFIHIWISPARCPRRMQSSISSQKTPKYKKLSRKTAKNLSILSCFMMECRWWDSNPHGFPNDFEFSCSSSIWCHPVISSDIWFPPHKNEKNASTNNNSKNPRFFDTFSLCSYFSIWNVQMEIGGMFRRDAGLNAVCLGTKRKESQG